jgi:putative colanic acid biosynthesis acetyltransferase WcaF
MRNAPKVDLSNYSRGDYHPGPLWRRAGWYLVSLAVVECALPWPTGLKMAVLRLFGADLGEGVVLKPRLRIKYPWLLSVGDHAWLGEEVWIDNLAMVRIGSHACLSQGATVLTGNHNRTSPAFDLRLGPVEIGEGAWIGAKAVVCPGTTVGSHAVLHAGSVAKGTLEADGIYEGNPAARIGIREILP